MGQLATPPLGNQCQNVSCRRYTPSAHHWISRNTWRPWNSAECHCYKQILPIARCLEALILSQSHSSFTSFNFRELTLDLLLGTELRFLKSQNLIYYFSLKLFDSNIHQLTSVALSCCFLHKCDLHGMYWLNWKISLIPAPTAFPRTDLGDSLETNALADCEEHQEQDQDKVRLHRKRNTSCKIHFYAEGSRIPYG